jgi:hypothetical protein
MAEFENKHIDRRTAPRYLRKGIVDEKDFEKYLKALPDLADRAVPIESAMENDDDVEDDDEE